MEQRGGGDFPPNKPTPQSEASPTAPTDFPARKLVRQLDFTGGGPATTSVEQPQIAKSIQPAPHQPLLGKVSQLQKPSSHLQPPQMLFMKMQQPTQPAAPPPHPSVRTIVKPESPRARPRQTVNEVKDGTPKKQKQCNCKHSRCLKLYCECFASGIYCDGCNCVNCHNNVENEADRREAVEATLERNPNAFRPKIASSPHGARDNREEAGEAVVSAKHNKGCHCKKSGCLKKYCECFQANILCSDNCKCMDCKNFEGSEERQALSHGDHANNMVYIQQAANAAITGFIGSSGYGSPPLTKKRKGHELFFGPTVKDPGPRLGQLQQDNQIKASVPSTSFPSARPGNNTSVMSPSKFTYRSLLADIIQPQDSRELCSVLVVYSAEAAKMLAAEKRTEDSRETSLPSSTQLQESQSQMHHDAEKALVADQTEVKPEEFGSDGVDVSKGRPMSPSTLALMCDEQDTMFTSTASSSGLTVDNNNVSERREEEGVTETYAEQERIVLTKFRDCLNRLITEGEIKETKYSSLAQTHSDNEKNLPSNVKSETRNQRPIISNGVSKLASSPQITSPVVTPTHGAVGNIPHLRVTPAKNEDIVRTKPEEEV
ncbi:hypothetical protein CASFOL_032637 [Castilleja foliolosa]|uniref:CRC domain-containing protein n=1 Tax=Castilleja foliolosa TaxID=1961234 RepID=A0ABD3C353_9LAMI